MTTRAGNVAVAGVISMSDSPFCRVGSAGAASSVKPGGSGGTLDDCVEPPWANCATRGDLPEGASDALGWYHENNPTMSGISGSGRTTIGVRTPQTASG
jgi:hypothetical protein